jgi:hypothetical protein
MVRMFCRGNSALTVAGGMIHWLVNNSVKNGVWVKISMIIIRASPILIKARALVSRKNMVAIVFRIFFIIGY